jgi:glyoxylase-like metal-dependent hydrolase (beta-lactamase superfamily II)
MTHLHTDHAGGLYHFPDTEILVSRTEYEQARGFQGQLRGYLSNHWPDWFAPTLVDFVPRTVEAFPKTFSLTEAGDVSLVPTPGHTAGHMSVLLHDGPLTYFFAGDVSYTEQTMVDLVVDGVSLDRKTALKSLKRTRHYVKNIPTVYLPSHDPASAERLAARRIALPQEHPAVAGQPVGNS